MDESTYHRIANEFLDTLADQLEDAIGDDVDVEIQGHILTLDLPSGGQYVLNKQAPTRQLWLSSPASGAWHFIHDPDKGWISTREPRVELTGLLVSELSAALKADIALDA